MIFVPGRCKTIRGAVLSSAKVGDYHTVRSQMQREMSSGSKLGNVLSRISHNARVSVYALSQGYDVLQDGSNGYRMVLNRRGIALSDKTF